MKVLHIGITSHFTEGMLYQDNILPDLNAKAGHDVTFISDIYCYVDGKLCSTEECDKRLSNGVRLIRIKYDNLGIKFLTEKIQKAKKIIEYLNEIKPDTILYHGMCGYELMDVAKYVKKNGISFYIDSHENFLNTAKTPIARLAYKYIHGYFIKKALPYARKILYVGMPERFFLKTLYHIPDHRMELFSLGGNLLPSEKRRQYRKEIIEKYRFPEDAIICAHSGKMIRGKKTEEVIRAFKNIADKRMRLLIFGMIPDEMESILLPLIETDDRIYFLGWKEAKEQELILGGTDLYLQPGTASATAQVALCYGCALLVNHLYKELMEDAVFYEEDQQGIEHVLNNITKDTQLLRIMQDKGRRIAEKKLDYARLAERYLH